MEKVDLAKQHKQYYTAKPHPELVDIAPAHFLSITGQGDPSGSEFATNIQALYTTAYTIKFNSKADGCDFKVPKLEGLWWYDETQFPNIVFRVFRVVFFSSICDVFLYDDSFVGRTEQLC